MCIGWMNPLLVPMNHTSHWPHSMTGFSGVC